MANEKELNEAMKFVAEATAKKGSALKEDELKNLSGGVDVWKVIKTAGIAVGGLSMACMAGMQAYANFRNGGVQQVKLTNEKLVTEEYQAPAGG